MNRKMSTFANGVLFRLYNIFAGLEPIHIRDLVVKVFSDGIKAMNSEVCGKHAMLYYYDPAAHGVCSITIKTMSGEWFMLQFQVQESVICLTSVLVGGKDNVVTEELLKLQDLIPWVYREYGVKPDTLFIRSK